MDILSNVFTVFCHLIFTLELLHSLDAIQLLLCLVYLITLTLKLASYEDKIASIE